MNALTIGKRTATCPVCHGRGNRPCTACNGTGRIAQVELVEHVTEPSA